MPLILSENEDTESGIRYEDQTGISYQYPKMYRGQMRPGERFIYYRGRKRLGGGRQPQIYFGAGIIGKVEADTSDPSRLRCAILDYRPFPQVVPFKIGKGDYFEKGGSRRGYFQRGVRNISEDEFEAIISAGKSENALPSTSTSAAVIGGKFYASQETIVKIERYALEVALAELKKMNPLAVITEQARNNPGFDVLVSKDGITRYVEVKGTARSVPQFLISQGEMEFSVRNAPSYSLMIVYDIDLMRQTHKLHRHEGAIDETRFGVRPLQWVCEALI